MWQYQYSDELYHWKYIKREKVNGKWKYYYDEDLNNAYKSGKQSEIAINAHQHGKTTEYVQKKKYEDTDNLFSTKSSYEITTDRSKDEITTYKRGKIERALADGERWIFEKFLKKRNR